MDNALTFKDVFKNSIVSLQNSLNISVLQIIIGLLIAFAIGMFIIYIYRITFDGVVYSNSFVTSLMMLGLVTSLIIMTISSNIVLSLGMVGALSIVRFRAAIKDPKDIVFQFWAIANGIASGAALYGIAIAGSLFIGLVLIIMAKKKFNISTYLLVIKYNNEIKDKVVDVTSKLESTLKSKTCIGSYVEETFELKRVGENTSFVEILSSIDGVESAILVKYNGDYAE